MKIQDWIAQNFDPPEMNVADPDNVLDLEFRDVVENRGGNGKIYYKFFLPDRNKVIFHPDAKGQAFIHRDRYLKK